MQKRWVSLRWHYPNQVKGRNQSVSSQPASASSPVWADYSMLFALERCSALFACRAHNVGQHSNERGAFVEAGSIGEGALLGRGLTILAPEFSIYLVEGFQVVGNEDGTGHRCALSLVLREREGCFESEKGASSGRLQPLPVVKVALIANENCISLNAQVFGQQTLTYWG